MHIHIHICAHMCMCTYTHVCIFAFSHLPRKILSYVYMETGTRMLTIGSFLIVKANREKVK